MIVSNIKYASRYYSLNPNFKAVFEFLANIGPEDMGDFSFDGFSGSIVMPDISAEPKVDCCLEAHREYLDIHFVLAGAEGFGYADINSLTPDTEYDEENDYLLLKGDFSRMTIGQNEFCIVFPEDAHAPVMCSCGDEKLKKVIVKIKL